MITITDVIHKIHATVGPEVPANLLNAGFRFYPCITSDIEETESRYLDKYGKGIPICFPLESYGHGVELVKGIHEYCTGKIPEGLDSKMPTDDYGKLYLFLYLLPIH